MPDATNSQAAEAIKPQVSDSVNDATIVGAETEQLHGGRDWRVWVIGA